MVLGERYSAITWYLNESNPSKAICAAIRKECYEHALEMEGGTVATLDKHGFSAAPPAQPKELLPGRSNLLRTPMPTPIVTPSKVTVTLKRAADMLKKGSRQVLFRVQDLETVSAARRVKLACGKHATHIQVKRNP